MQWSNSYPDCFIHREIYCSNHRLKVGLAQGTVLDCVVNNDVSIPDDDRTPVRRP
jgi:hypothetical protein